MRVAFCGAQCTGKSTQAKLLGDKGYTVVPSASRIVANLGLEVNRDGTLSSQMIISGIAEYQLEEYKGYENVVWERTHFDICGYSKTCNLGAAKWDYINCSLELARKQAKGYFNLIFYFPAYPLGNFSGEINDGIRDVDPEYREVVSGNIKEALLDCEAQFIVVPEGSESSVAEFISWHIEDYIKSSKERNYYDKRQHDSTRVISK